MQLQMVLPILLTVYRELTKSPKQIEETDASKALVPLQRVLYNVLAAGNAQWISALLSTNIPTLSSASPSSLSSVTESACDVLMRGLKVVLDPATYDVARAAALEGAWLSAPFLANLGAPGTFVCSSHCIIQNVSLFVHMFFCSL
jgi:hypothetical protein